ncbi:MAG: tripartite tricarboxylate transporter substrate binding protein [Afipia sp.]|jgi:tripartite-type tricarboxylate transporter receptor subunit TctC|nr:tripartite tricarboxylate transporter substrate binding protein [Afipia sp.]
MLPIRLRSAAAVLAAAFSVTAAYSAHGQTNYPERPIRLVVAFAPGGIADIATRAVADRLAESIGTSVVVENRGGGGGNIAAAAVAKAEPDGYTVLVSTTSVAVNPLLSDKTGYDLSKDLVPVIQIASAPNIIVATPGIGARTLAEATAKAKGAKFSFGSPGNGSTSHLTGTYLFNTLSGADVTHIGYRGGAPAVSDTVGGQTQFAVVPVPVAAGLIQGGQLVPLAVTSATRLKDWPNVPTVAESGAVFAGYVDETWVGVFLPAGTPPAIVAKLNEHFNKVLAEPATEARLRTASLEKQGGSAASFAQYLAAETAKWQRVVRETGVKVD